VGRSDKHVATNLTAEMNPFMVF